MFGLLHLIWKSLGPSILLQMTLFHSFYGWIILHCIYVLHLYPFIRHFGCLYDLAIVNSAATNTGVHVSLQIRVFSRYMPRSGTLLELMYDPVPLFNALWRTSVRRNSATVPMVSREQNYFSSTWENLFHVVDSQQPEAPVKAWDNNNSLKLSIHESENEGKRQENHHLSQGRLV